jgi:hypothetical protein
MPIIDKINRAKSEYSIKLAAFRKAASEDAINEKELIGMLADMIEIKTEVEILTRVENHRASH